MELKGAAAIVTGSSSGIGAATARLLAERGANVVINFSRSREPAEKVAEECRGHGVEALVVQANVAEDAECKRLVKETVDRFGRLDVLMNNAGTTKFVAHDDLDGLSAEDFQSIFAVNLIGPYQMARAAAPAMREAGKGSIVNVSSIAGVMGTGSSIAYAASKGALNTMTLSLARVLGPEIRVNTICPGFVAGDWLRQGMGAERYEKTKTNLETTTPLRAAGDAEKMAEAAMMFIAAASHITGEFLIVDGGMHLGAVPVGGR